MRIEPIGVFGFVLRRVQIQVSGVIQFVFLVLGVSFQSKFSWHVEFL